MIYGKEFVTAISKLRVYSFCVNDDKKRFEFHSDGFTALIETEYQLPVPKQSRAFRESIALRPIREYDYVNGIIDLDCNRLEKYLQQFDEKSADLNLALPVLGIKATPKIVIINEQYFCDKALYDCMGYQRATMLEKDKGAILVLDEAYAFSEEITYHDRLIIWCPKLDQIPIQGDLFADIAETPYEPKAKITIFSGGKEETATVGELGKEKKATKRVRKHAEV